MSPRNKDEEKKRKKTACQDLQMSHYIIIPPPFPALKKGQKDYEGDLPV